MMEKVLIVAGGKGERLRPITNTIAKPMVQVGGKPVLEHNLDLFKKYGFQDFIFALCYLPETIENYFGNGEKFGVKIEYTYENPDKPLGNAGALTLSKDKLNDTFIVTSGDVLRNLDVTTVLKKHKDSKSIVSLVLYKNFKEHPTSMVAFDEKNSVTKFIERPSKEDVKGKFVWTNASFYLLEPKIFDYIGDSEFSDFGYHIFPKLLEAHEKVCAIPKDHYLIDVGTEEKLEQANQDFAKGVIKI